MDLLPLNTPLYFHGAIADLLGLPEADIERRASEEKWPMLKELFVDRRNETTIENIYLLEHLPDDIAMAICSRKIELFNAQVDKYQRKVDYYSTELNRLECHSSRPDNEVLV